MRDSVRLRAYGQQDPLVEYKNESRNLFQRLLEQIDSTIVDSLLRVQVHQHESPHPSVSSPQRNIPKPAPSGQAPESARGAEKVGRNDPCPCGSGKKFKKCHGS